LIKTIIRPQGEFWFPECILCGSGNLGGVVCLSPACHEKHGLHVVTGEKIIKLHEDGHAWRGCQFCESRMLADAGAWGSLAICTECWNLFAEAGRYPPVTPFGVTQEVVTKRLEIGWDQKSRTKVRVKK